MSLQSQIKNMKRLGTLLNQNLSYIYGEKESGPNGAKKEFLLTGRAFLSALGKDLGFKEQNVNVNKSGIACSGSVTLRGMWDDSGICVVLEQDIIGSDHFCYRTISHMTDYNGGVHRVITLAELKAGEYGDIIADIILLKEGKGNERIAA